VAFALRRASRDGGDPTPPPSADGAMTLMEHLRELRGRMVKAVIAIVVCAIISAFLYSVILDLLSDPFKAAVAKLEDDHPGLNAKLTINDPAGPLMLQLKISLVTGVILSSPIWLWQIWAFVVPGLHRNERKWSLAFALVAGPLFMAGVLLGYYVLPKGLGILLDFTPADVSNFIELDKYLNFILRMLLVFGVAFEIPLFVVLLNLAGVVSGRALGKARPWIVLGTFVFAAVATPSTDPISMLFLAVPMTVLFLISEVVARFLDRRRSRSEPAYDEIDDDEVSELAESHDPVDDRPSRLDDD